MDRDGYYKETSEDVKYDRYCSQEISEKHSESLSVFLLHNIFPLCRYVLARDIALVLCIYEGR